MKYIRQIVVLAMLVACMTMLMSTAWASDGESGDGSTWGQIKDAASDVKDTIVENLPGVIDGAKEAGGKLVDAAKEKGPEMLEAAQEKGAEALETAKEGLEDAQEAVTDFRQQQEDYFWGWFKNQIHPDQSSDDTDGSDAQGNPAASDPQAGTAGKDGEAPESGSENQGIVVPPVYYFNPNQVNSTAAGTGDDSTAATNETGILAQDYPEAGSSVAATEPEAQPPETQEPETQEPKKASNELPEIFPQNKTPERSPSSGLSGILGGKDSTTMLTIVAVLILVAGVVVYRKADEP